MAYDLGQTVRLPLSVKDFNGAPTNATVTIAVTRPDGTTFPAPVITNDSVGEYHADVTTDTGYGVWQWRYNASGAVAPSVYTGQFFVRSPGPRIVSLREAKDYLNKSRVVVTDDDELRDFVDMTKVAIEGIKGAVVPRIVVEYYDGKGKPAIWLRSGPLLSVTSISEVWAPGDVRTLTEEPDLSAGASTNQFQVDIPKRRVVRRESGINFYFPCGVKNIKVTYRIGMEPITDNVRLASLELIGHFWRASQITSGGQRPRTPEADTIIASFGVPTRVREMLGKKRAPKLGS